MIIFENDKEKLRAFELFEAEFTWIAALHESAHAFICASLFENGFEHISLSPDSVGGTPYLKLRDTASIRKTFEGRLGLVCTALAGPLADALYFTSRGIKVCPRCTGAGGSIRYDVADDAKVMEVITTDGLSGDELQASFDVVRRLLVQDWGKVEKIAKALLAAPGGRLEYSDVMEIIKSS